MEGSVTTIDCLRMEPADNGVIITFDERTQHPKKKGETYANTDYNCRKEVFDFDSDQDEGFSEAFERFKVLFSEQMKGRKKKSGESKY